jgi:hypothetical protein
MKKGFNIDAYLREAEERFSGFDGDMSDFDGYDDFDGFDGYGADGEDDFSMAAGVVKTATPYQVTVTNSTAGTLNAVLFGKNSHLLSANFGSAAGIVVSPAQSNVTYVELLQQSAEQPFETSLIRIQSQNTAQITQIITVTSKDANGQSCTVPIITQSYFSANQFQAGILDVPHAVRIDGNTSLGFPVMANTAVVFTLFPASKVNTAAVLSGKSATTSYARPTVGGAARPSVKATNRGLAGRRSLGLKRGR